MRLNLGWVTAWQEGEGQEAESLTFCKILSKTDKFKEVCYNLIAFHVGWAIFRRTEVRGMYCSKSGCHCRSGCRG